MKIHEPHVANTCVTQSLRLCLSYVTLTITVAHSLVLCRSPRIFEQKRDCSQSMKTAKAGSTPAKVVKLQNSHRQKVFENYARPVGYIRRTYSISAHWNFYSACWI